MNRRHVGLLDPDCLVIPGDGADRKAGSYLLRDMSLPDADHQIAKVMVLKQSDPDAKQGIDASIPTPTPMWQLH